MKRFREARDRGCAHLLSQQHADGSFGNPVLGAIEYYKVPAAVQVMRCRLTRQTGCAPGFASTV